jgi:hypothetical protein
MSLDLECRWHEEWWASSASTAMRRVSGSAEPTLRANSGGPITRRRTERVLVSVLRDDGSRLHLPRTLRAGLRFGRADPLSRVLAALARVGLDDPEQLRARYPAPSHPLLCRVVPNAPWAEDASSLPDATLLEHALLLGLCTAYQYDPARPVLWTRASLTRCVELHDPAGFYA